MEAPQSTSPANGDRAGIVDSYAEFWLSFDSDELKQATSDDVEFGDAYEQFSKLADAD